MRGASNNPQLVVMNNTNKTQQVTLFSPSPNALGPLNATTQYTWDLTPETFTGNKAVMISVRQKGSTGVFQTLVAPLATASLDGVVAALNTLNIGSFWSEVIAGRSLIITANDHFQFLQINLAASLIIPIWQSTWNVAFNNVGITVSEIFQVIDDSTGTAPEFHTNSGAAPFSFVGSTTTAFLPADLVDGDAMRLRISYSPNSVVTTVHAVIKQNGIVILDQTQTGNPLTGFNFSFVYRLNAVYDFAVTVN